MERQSVRESITPARSPPVAVAAHTPILLLLPPPLPLSVGLVEAG